MPVNRRHRRQIGCPAEKNVCIQDRWQFLYHLQYPDRPLPDPSMSSKSQSFWSINGFNLTLPVLETGVSHPHEREQPRRNRRKREDDLQIRSVRQRLMEVKSNQDTIRSELAEEIDLLKGTLQQRDERIDRLEILVGALLEANPPDKKIPNHLRKMIEKDAPSALEHGHEGDLFRQTNAVPMHDSAVELPLQGGLSNFQSSSVCNETPGLLSDRNLDTTQYTHSQADTSVSKWAFEDLFNFEVPGNDVSFC